MRICSLGFMLLAACKTTSLSKPAEVQVSSSAILGRNFDLDAPLPAQNSCLEMSSLTDSDYLFIPPKNGRALYEFGMQVDDNTAFKLKTPELTLGSDGLLEFSSDARAVIRLEGSAADVTRTSLQSVENGIYRLKPESIPRLRFTSEAAALVTQLKSAQSESERQAAWEAFRRTCGTHFVSGYSLGHTMAASLHTTFHNRTEALRYTILILNNELESRRALIPWAFSPYTRYISLARKQAGFNPADYGDVAELICASENTQPCVDQLRNFHEKVLPAYGKWLSSQSGRAETFLPLAVLESPEYKSYSVIDPDLSLTVDASRSDEWPSLRKKFRDALRRNTRDQDRIEALGVVIKAGFDAELVKLRDEKRRISELAKPCFEVGSLDLDACNQNVTRLPDVTESLDILYQEIPGFMPLCSRFKAASFNKADASLAPLLFSSDEYQSMSLIFTQPVIKQSLMEKIPAAAGNFDAFAVSADVWGPRHPDFDCATVDKVFRDIKGSLQFEGGLTEVESLVGFVSISELNLANQRLRDDLSALGRLPRLETLSLANNRLKESADGIMNLKQVKALDLSNNRFISAKTLRDFLASRARALQPVVVKARNVEACSDALLSE